MEIIEADFSVLVAVILAAALVVYRVSMLHTRKIFHLSLMQVFILIFVPGFMLPLSFAYIRDIIERPRVGGAIFSDELLLSVILFSSLLMYGGLCIHAVTKMLSGPGMLRYDDSEVADINRFFHLTFSHNMAYSGLLLALTSLVMLEVSHVSDGGINGFIELLIKSLLLGAGLFGTLLIYTRSEDEYIGKWSDLKVFFAISWVSFMVLLYLIRRIDPSIREYDLLLPAVLSLTFLGVFNIVLVARRVKRGWRVSFRWGRLRRLVQFSHNAD